MSDALTLRRAYKGIRFQLPERLRVWESIGVRKQVSQPALLFYLCAFGIAVSLLFGGGTRGGFLSDAILQMAAIPLLLVALWKLFEIPVTQQMKIPLLFCVAIVIIPVVQLIPLPPWLWTNLPGREISAETFDILGQAPPWMPISVVPYETWLSALSLIPPLGIFLATVQLSYRDRRWLTWVFLLIGIVSVFIGMMQVAQGQASPLRFFEITNDTEAVGFFANRNHFAALLYSLTLFAAAWAISATLLGQAEGRQKYDTLVIVVVIGAFMLLVVLLAGQMMARSRTGLLLSIVALLGALALVIKDRRVGTHVTAIRLIVGAIVLVVIFAAQFALYRVFQRFAIDPLEDARLPFARNTLEAALAYLPFGSGLGTFVPVYAMFEKPKDLYFDTYANHAHNDYLELWLNTGLLGLSLVGMFLVWFGLRALEIWRTAPPAGASELDWDLVRAAVLIVGLLLAHSLIDYPLRTGAIMAVMAFACALLIEPPLGAEPAVISAPTLKPTSEATSAPMPDGEMADSARIVKPAPVNKTKLPDMPAIGSQPIPTAPKPKPTQASEVRKGATLTKEMFLKRLHGGMAERKPAPDNKTKLPDMRTIESPPIPTEPKSKPASEVKPAPVDKTQLPSMPAIGSPPIPTEPKPKPASETPGASEGGTLAPDQRWGTDIEWPEQWSKKADSPPHSGDGEKSNLEKPPEDRD
jgi:O-antigen ligase